jgi:hypothetical protein
MTRNETSKKVDPELVQPLIPLVGPWTENLRVRSRRSAQGVSFSGLRRCGIDIEQAPAPCSAYA